MLRAVPALPETPAEAHARRMRKLVAQQAGGEDSRTITVTPRQRLLLAEVLHGVSGPEAESLRLLLDLDDLISAGQASDSLVSPGDTPVGTGVWP